MIDREKLDMELYLRWQRADSERRKAQRDGNNDMYLYWHGTAEAWRSARMLARSAGVEAVQA